MRPEALTGRDLAAALVVVLVWGVNLVAMKFALRERRALRPAAHPACAPSGWNRPAERP
ncbi:hypothetical protein [Polaromonas sp.]|uniref:hypothetical protein n=1 Tax=Polaromonas sp. TaxID=1869339 RepID=UPI001A21326D|nr:hypothetical protein [Burkholderiales bacterium]